MTIEATQATATSSPVVIIGGGPAGLMAAEVIATAGLSVTIYERKPSAGRKFLMAGRGGLNLTHSEPLDKFIARYGAASKLLAPVIGDFPPEALKKWSEGLGEPTFIGTSGRVFPKSFKASPLLRAWQKRLGALGVQVLYQREWKGWDEAGRLVFSTAGGETETVMPAATLLALGGGSWPRLGSDGGWVDIVRQRNIPVMPLKAANCGFSVSWSEHFSGRFAGEPLKAIALTFGGATVPGEALVTARGIEGGAVYALSAPLRDEISARGFATLLVDLKPGISIEELARRLAKPRQAKSLSNFLRVAGGFSPVAIALLRETEAGKNLQGLSAEALAALIKTFPLRLEAAFPLERAISSAGGIPLAALDAGFMLRDLPGVFAAGEMLDWEAPTGGYLLQAVFSTAVRAATGLSAWLKAARPAPENLTSRA